MGNMQWAEALYELLSHTVDGRDQSINVTYNTRSGGEPLVYVVVQRHGARLGKKGYGTADNLADAITEAIQDFKANDLRCPHCNAHMPEPDAIKWGTR